MGYLPDIFARNLSTRKSNIIGMIVPKITNTFFSSLVEYMYEIAFSSNYLINLMISQEDPLREKRHLEILESMKVIGIIISITQETKDYKIFERISNRNIPIVFINRVPEMDDIHLVDITDYETTLKVIENARKKGHRNIVYKNISEFNNNSELKDSIILKECEEAIHSPEVMVYKELHEIRSSIRLKELFLRRKFPELIYSTIQTLAY